MRLNKYTLRFYWRKFCNFFGFCPCGCRVNYTTRGRAICPSCGH